MFDKIDRAIRDLNHARIDGTRALKLWLATRIFPRFAKTSTIENKEAPILVLRLDDKLGDSITATGFLHELKRNYPRNKLIVLAGRNSGLIYKPLPFIDEVHVVKKGLAETLKIFKQLKRTDCRFIFNTSPILNPQVVFLVCFLKAFRKFSFLNFAVGGFTDYIRFDRHSDHVTLRYLRALEGVQIMNPVLDYQLKLTADAETEKAHRAVADLRTRAKKLVILNSFAGARLRNLNAQTSSEIVRGLLKARPDLIVVSIGSHDDLPKVISWIKQLANPRWVSFPAGTSLAFNLALVQQADLVITPDTSLVHVASAFKKPLVAIYREDKGLEKNALIWAPYQTRHKVVYAPFDAARPEDINSVAVTYVVENALQMLPP